MNSKYIQTLVAQFISLFLAFLSLKLAANQFDDYDFGVYNVVRRFLAIINYPFLVGLGISLPIYLANDNPKKDYQAKVITTAFIFCFISLLLFSALNLAFPSLLVNLILGKKFQSLSWIIVLGFGNLYLYTLLYAIYRGRQEFLKANIFQVVGAGLSQIFAFLLSDGTIFSYFSIYVVLLSIVNLTVIFDLYKRKLISTRIKFLEIKSNAKKILLFGVPRIPGEFALFGLMSFPLFFIAKYDSVEMAGYLAIGFTLVQLVASMYEFLGTLLLPKSAQMASNNNFIQLKNLVNKIAGLSFITSTVISFFIYTNLEFILNLLQKNRFINNLEYAQIIIFIIPFYIIYLILRNPQDAISVKPYNSYNLCICFIVQFLFLLASRFATNKFLFYYASITVPFFLLGLFSFIAWNRLITRNLG